MMRHITDEEKQLMDKLHNAETTESEKEEIRQKLQRIDEEQTKDYPFVH